MRNSFWDTYNRPAPDVSGADRAADVDRRMHALELRALRLSTICQAMWTLLQERTGLTEQQLIDRVHELDMEDGVQDDIAMPSVGVCPHCSRPLSMEYHRCLYCGHVPERHSAFEAL